MPAFEVYVETFRIDEWRDGCVYRTSSLGYGWVDDAVVKANQPGDTGLIYAAASDYFACCNSTIRMRRP